MAYLPLNNYNYDSGYRRIQSGPNHEQFIVLTSGSSAYGADNGIVVAGSPLSGTIAAGAWDYDDNWRYVPGTLPSQSGSALDPTPYNVSGALDTYDGTRIATRTSVAGAQAASAIGPEANVLLPRQAPLQPRADVTRPEKYMYFGGAAPDNQNYSPYNTPDANTAAEGKTGGPVTHRTYENTLITNVLGSQGTSDRSQWRYHQPVYCQTFTETVRSDSPGLMSTPLRYVYRGHATQYNLNYPLGNGFQQLPYDDQTGGCGIPVSCPTTNGLPTFLTPGDLLTANPPCNYVNVLWFNTNSLSSIGSGTTYEIQETDVGSFIYFKVTYPDGSEDASSASCFPAVATSLGLNFFRLWNQGITISSFPYNLYSASDVYGNIYTESEWTNGTSSLPLPYYPVISKLNKNRELLWSYDYRVFDGYITNTISAHCLVNNEIHAFNFKRSSVDVQKVYLQRLIIDTSDGSLKRIDQIEYTNSSVTSNINHTNIRVVQVQTNGNGTYWLAANVPDEFVVGGVGTRVTGALICIQSADDNTLTTVWTYELLQQYLPPSPRYEGQLVDGFLLNLDLGIIYAQTYSQASFRRPTLVILSAATGAVVYKHPFALVNGDPTVLGYRANYIDSDGNLYQVANNSTTVTGMGGGPVWFSKKDSSKNIIWMKDFSASINASIDCSTNSLLVINNKLLFAHITYSGGLPVSRKARLLIANAETGVLERIIRIETPVDFDSTQITILNSVNPEEFTIIWSDETYYMTLNINNVPPNGTVIPTPASGQVYTINDVSIVASTDYTSYTETAYTLPPDRLWPVTSVYQILPVASGVPAPPTETTNVSGVALQYTP